MAAFAQSVCVLSLRRLARVQSNGCILSAVSMDTNVSVLETVPRPKAWKSQVSSCDGNRVFLGDRCSERSALRLVLLQSFAKCFGWQVFTWFIPLHFQ